MRMPGRRKKRWLLPVLAAVLLLAGAAARDWLHYRDRLYPGIGLRDRDVGGLSRKELEVQLAGLPLTFRGPGDILARLPLKAVGIRVDPEETWAGGYKLGRRRPWPFNWGERLALLRRGALIPLAYHVDEELLAGGLDSLAASFDREPRDAYFDVRDHGTILQEEEEGFLVDREELRLGLRRVLSRWNAPLEVEIPVGEVLAPEITVSLLEKRGLTGLMSSFSTVFNRENANRSHNIGLGASYLDNYFLPPGGLLSVNAVLGDSTKEKGYREAPVILEGELVPGLGGGLCQVSTTLYNAALLAILPVPERRNHALTVPYVDPGRDASIAFAATDLKIYNNRDHYIWITALVEEDRLHFRIFGQPFPERVEIASHILETYDPPLRYKYDPEIPAGEEVVEEGQPGYLAEVWRRIYRGEQLVKEERISLDRYRPRPTVVRQGPPGQKGL